MLFTKLFIPMINDYLAILSLDKHYNNISLTFQNIVFVINNCMIWCVMLFFLGKSHYLFMVWFLYDAMTYLTDEEYGKIHDVVRKSIFNKHRSS